MWQARLRLASLWLSATARVVADWALRLTPLAEIHRLAGDAAIVQGWHRATVLAITPFVLLAPLNGILSNSLPRRAVLVGASLFTLVTVAACAMTGASWSLCLAVVAVGSAIYSPARYAVLPAAAVDASMTLPRVNGLFEMGAAGAIVGGIMLGWQLTGLADNTPTLDRLILPLLGLNLLCFLTAVPVSFPSDFNRPEKPGAALKGFFRDIGRVFSQHVPRGSLLGLAAFQAVVTAGTGALVGQVIANGAGLGEFLRALLFVGGGAALGSFTASLQGNPRRNPGLIPFGATGLLLALGWAALSLGPDAPLPLIPCLLIGFMGSLVNVPLRAAYMATVPDDARGNAMSVMNTAIYVLTVGLALLMIALGGVLSGPVAQMGFLAVLAAAGAGLAWWVLLPQAAEHVCEMILTPMYDVHAFGPGRDIIPQRGPLLIVANHSSYLDPFWTFKIVPRRVTPMMTSLFYDLPFIHWLMVHIVGAIRVPNAVVRREAPELHDAIKVLKAGGCVLVFPEAILRRTESQLLRPFGQGVWHILREVPNALVLACWIEGGWGSFMSYCGGPPLKNKRIDFWHRIDIGVAVPRPLDPAVLAEHRTTREHLQQACLDCRRHLGLSVPENNDFTPGTGDEDETHTNNP